MDLTAMQSIFIYSIVVKSLHFQQVRKLKDLDTKRSVDADEELMKVLSISTHPIQQMF